MPADAHRLYYLDNFRKVLAWLWQRYQDLLASDELRFAALFASLPVESAALLVRMITRRGALFRSSRLMYAEIGCPRAAAAALIDAGFVDAQPELTWSDLQRLLTKVELAALFEVHTNVRRLPKPQMVQHLSTTWSATHARSTWSSRTGESIYHLTVAPLCDRLRILFFGNFRQDWSEFVLTDLGIYRYETIEMDARARAFRTRGEIDQFYRLYVCRELLHAGTPAQQVLEQIPEAFPDCEWIEARRTRLVFQVAQQLEKDREWPQALAAYLGCNDPRAQIRAVRLLERQGRWQEAWDRLLLIEPACAEEPARQQWERLRQRLSRRLGCAAPARRARSPWPTLHLELPRPAEPVAVESLAAEHLTAPDAPVFYVENALLNSLLGLWGWEAIFAPLPGAFFHPFQAAPADLLAPQFCERRAAQLAACYASLESGDYRERITRTFEQKAGVASPFVAWGQLTPPLLALALECIAPEHLRCCFERILADIGANRAGLPDLVQFFPLQRRYRLIEVKGPGDHLQSNQIRWLSFCAAAGIEIAVCKVAFLP